MSDFLFIIPDGWIQIGQDILGEIGSSVGDWLNIGDLGSLSEELRTRGILVGDQNIAEAKMFNGEVLAIRIG